MDFYCVIVYLISVINLDQNICYLHHFPSLSPTVLSSFESEIKIIFLTSSYQLLSYYIYTIGEYFRLYIILPIPSIVHVIVWNMQDKWKNNMMLESSIWLIWNMIRLYLKWRKCLDIRYKFIQYITLTNIENIPQIMRIEG